MGTEHSRAKVYYTFSWRYATTLVGGTLYIWLEVRYTFGRRYAIPLIGGTLHLYLRALALPSFGGVGGGSPPPREGSGVGLRFLLQSTLPPQIYPRFLHQSSP